MFSIEVGISSGILAATILFLSSFDSIDIEGSISLLHLNLRFVTMQYFIAAVTFLG
jgi:hypothetical protein